MAKTAPRRRGGTPPACPCGTGLPYPDCCGPLHRGDGTAGTAEALMRSRFSAFAVGDPDYLLRSWHSSTRPARLRLDPAQRWTRLEILERTGGGLLDSAGTVAFRAHYRAAGRPGTVDEHSRFVREDGGWVYLDALPDGPG
ncbi:YchJ family metal-binding protein [Micromonospora sp. WMMD987]|uniref:YchJ family protein n=1 Tax=Micromonospora sp. WMMD987 TaxID=3016089 RepID=UPI00249CAFBA|nr:YchJ family metal-binding protein [Micromonospora sp. WMMD987]WFE92757.1 YchJ family metal-binding protein [Micromonospora sp. WMMD987]